MSIQGRIQSLRSRVIGRKYSVVNRVLLHQSNLTENLQLFQRLYPDFSIMPVLKANAYGHGLVEIARILNKVACDFVIVDGYFEAAKIRAISRHRILVLGYIMPENVDLLDTKKCSFVVQDIAGLKAFGALNRPVNIHLELNTGMNRLGLSRPELDDYLAVFRAFPKLRLEGVMTHLADADNASDTSFTDGQVNRFDGLVEAVMQAGFSPKFIHIAQTAGSLKVQSKYANGIRLGIGLYGVSPLNSADQQAKTLAGLKPVLELRSRVIKVIALQKGDRVSYNGTFTAPGAMKIAVLPLGYYEGVSRELSNAGVVTYGPHTLPIVGRVCMNHTMVDCTDTDIMVGDELTVISADPSQLNSVARICRDHDLFNYGLVTKISSSIRRVIV